MGASSWPSATEILDAKTKVSEMSGREVEDLKVVVSPYRICPLGAHIDHQGGVVSAMTINKGIILAFVSSFDTQIVLRSGQFSGEVKFRENRSIKEDHIEKGHGNLMVHGIIGFISGSEGLDSSGLSSSAAVGIAYLLALESANNLSMSTSDNIDLDKIIENEYLGLRNGILDQSAILLSKYGYLTVMNCKTKAHTLVGHSISPGDTASDGPIEYKILLSFSGVKHCLKDNPGYNCRVAECQEAAKFLLCASGAENVEPRLCEVDPHIYETHKHLLKAKLAKRAEHYFSENKRVVEGVDAWASGNIVEFGRLISASGLSSIQNYECGCEPMIQLYEILLKAPGVFGARFSGAGFRGCCLAFVDSHQAEAAAAFVQREYCKVQPELAGQDCKIIKAKERSESGNMDKWQR
ncbi:hypothetical protein HPP92_000193 [Vanilla planifolia]|uniref:Galacturonokinase n=1 Tax=Vanilla planifolia TaxID=51239 RepID=A0A835VE64_VANPL|nr:hypothetical protein HPP92_000193 [Vanilla planifolia]